MMDPLSEVFSLLNVRAARCTRFEASGKWAYRFPAKPALKFGAILRGHCWMDFGDGHRHRLAAGDSFLLANAPGYVLANDDQAIPADGIAMFDWAHADVARHEGDDTILVAGSFQFDASDAQLLLDALPRVLHIPARHPSAGVIRTTLEMITPEIMGPQIGAALLTDRLVDVLLILVLRAALDQDGGRDLGWIGALTDPKIGKAMRLMHHDPAHPWTLALLCSAVAMSRSAFTQRFRTLVGRAPLDYLLRWRMRIARDLLRRGSTVAAAALHVGYASESAFRNAYKRLHGDTPKRCRANGAPPLQATYSSTAT
jgi:AraC-like DNA-binding protein